MSDNVTLQEVFAKRFAPARHVLQSAAHAMKTGQPERTIFACLVHDVTQNLIKADHGYWGAQIFAPYVDERVSVGRQISSGAAVLPRRIGWLRVPGDATTESSGTRLRAG